MTDHQPPQNFPQLSEHLWIVPRQSGPSTWTIGDLSEEVDDAIDYLCAHMASFEGSKEQGSEQDASERDGVNDEDLVAAVTALLLDGVAQGRDMDMRLADLHAGRPTQRWYEPVDEEIVVWRPSVSVEDLAEYAKHPNDLIRESAKLEWLQRLGDHDCDRNKLAVDADTPVVSSWHIAEYELLARTACLAFLRVWPAPAAD